MLTSVQLTEENHKFCKDNHLKFSDLMREAIFQHKQIVEGVLTDNLNELRTKVEYYKKTAIELREIVDILKSELNVKNGK